MKIIPLVLSLFCAFFSIGQKSYYFSNALPPDGEGLNQIDARFFGNYTNDDGTMVYVFDESGVRTVSTNVSSISRKTLRESSQYAVRNGFIFGVVAGDSIPCVREGENYFFGVRNRDVLIGEGSMNTLKAVGQGKYILNFYDKGEYLPVLIQFKGNQLEMRDFDYELETTLFDFIAEKKGVQEPGVEHIALRPTQEEFDQLFANGIFAGMQLFKKEVE
jgi:hypothetical protein